MACCTCVFIILLNILAILLPWLMCTYKGKCYRSVTSVAWIVCNIVYICRWRCYLYENTGTSTTKVITGLINVHYLLINFVMSATSINERFLADDYFKWQRTYALHYVYESTYSSDLNILFYSDEWPIQDLKFIIELRLTATWEAYRKTIQFNRCMGQICKYLDTNLCDG